MADQRCGVGGSVPTRKRGHQHHPRQSGTRRSNVPAVDVIAALWGENLPDYIQQQQSSSAERPLPPTQNNGDDDDDDDCANNNVSGTASTFVDEHYDHQLLTQNIGGIGGGIDDYNDDDADDDNRYNNNPVAKLASPSDKNIDCDDEMNATNNTADDGEAKTRKTSPTTKKIRKSKTKSSDGSTPSKKKIVTADDGSTPKQRRKRPLATLVGGGPNGERPPLEGAAADDVPMDTENDPEAAEWLKLRCTSERTEVVAEREYRRQNRRCADYPGLAFGRSIFSSDTMMKFNIIRNELHNIMKTQLKRVRKRDFIGGSQAAVVVFFSFL